MTISVGRFDGPCQGLTVKVEPLGGVMGNGTPVLPEHVWCHKPIGVDDPPYPTVYYLYSRSGSTRYSYGHKTWKVDGSQLPG